jgi:hypothetical protein
MKLYSYVLRYDRGAAPNPFWGTCTLVICKPAIRLHAQIDDWVVGLGSKNSLIGDISTSVVYAMKVTAKLTMTAYDQFCTTSLPEKIPQWESQDYSLRMGDCIYDYGNGEYPKIRKSVHCEVQRKPDLSGKYALLSKEFYYFGDHPVLLPNNLLPIIHRTQGHKSNLNQPYVKSFVDWIENLGYKKNQLYGKPQFSDDLSGESDTRGKCSPRKLLARVIQRIATSC